ncbi:nuclear transport factor 2 family protein [Amycolatopsis sp. OK19-0408]|uniref:Nuclear transport factor 2 family protein n=1 Tax=Amycolatopsis iheyensis TaxID=2945988 RepID=A0A9X2SJY5_9PSEU|nr:nuclear transport factor 2 family protein [Amycolatopsis iheyensis]MCR6483311.1 nuclear transport factor 2 family protein [Amycolatopsis iheyensis]
MATVAELMEANLLRVFNERDDERRAKAIAVTYAADVVFADPEGVATGRDALNAKAKGLLAQSPGFVFAPAGPVLVNHDLGHLAWELGPEGAPPVVRGIDVALVEDGVIVKLYTMLLPD